MRASRRSTTNWNARLPRLPTLAASLFLAGCSLHAAPSTAPVERTLLAPLPARLTKPCAEPAFVPVRDEYALDEILRLWTADAENLSTCGTRLKALVAAVEARDRIQGAER